MSYIQHNVPHNSSGYTRSSLCETLRLRRFTRVTRLCQGEDFKQVHIVDQFTFLFINTLWKRDGSWIRGFRAIISSYSTKKKGGVAYDSTEEVWFTN